jgi:GntR family transcriptional repressor for pyruvate dehydrogenase complex
MEAREALEPPVAALVARHRSAKVISELGRILKTMRAHAARDEFEAYLDADKAFHSALAEAAGNSLVTAALSPLLHSMDQRVYREFTRHYYLKNVDDLEAVASLHSDVLCAIERGDGQTASAKMVEHWTRMREIWEA